MVVEVQRRQDLRKHVSWPAYLVNARARLGCPAVLLVICPEPGVAAWARRPIPLGHPGFELRPLVLGPEQVPVLIGHEGRDLAPELVVASAAVHGGGPDGAKVLATMVDCLDQIPFDQARGYIDEVLAMLPEAARDLLEKMMQAGTREYKSDFARRYYSQGMTEGEARGEAKAILAVLSARGITVPQDIRARISECTDLDQLETWTRRAATAHSVEELFG